MAAAVGARAEDVRRLQAQVEQMKERLDFISPMLPLVNFVQDFFQKVECEASLQLMRLKKAQVMQCGPEADEEGMSNAQLETVKFLHFVTDAVIASRLSAALQPGGEPAEPAAELGQPRAIRSVSSPTRIEPGPRASSPVPEPRQLPVFGGDSGGSGGWAGAGTRAQRLSGARPPAQRAEAPQPDHEVERSGGYLLRLPASPPASLASTKLGYAELPRQAASGKPGLRESLPPRMSPRLPGEPVRSSCGGDDSLSESLSFQACQATLEPGTGGTVGAMPEDRPCDVQGPNGLVLGRGSWAAAYRLAQGGRRDALRLLCTSGIVTARELSDDLTVISEEHIEECVLIATEMLQTWPLDIWARQPLEAKRFFEARLTAMYQKKFGEQKP